MRKAFVGAESAPYPTGNKQTISTFVDQTHIQRTRPRRKTVFFKTSLQEFILGSTSVELSTQSVGNNGLGSTLGQMLIYLCEELNSMNSESTFKVRRFLGVSKQRTDETGIFLYPDNSF